MVPYSGGQLNPASCECDLDASVTGIQWEYYASVDCLAPDNNCAAAGEAHALVKGTLKRGGDSDSDGGTWHDQYDEGVKEDDGSWNLSMSGTVGDGDKVKVWYGGHAKAEHSLTDDAYWTGAHGEVDGDTPSVDLTNCESP